MSLKYSPRDFKVRELLEFDPDPAGEFYVHLLRKEKLDTQEAQEGFYIDSWLKRLFAMVYGGTEVQKQQSLMAIAHRIRGEEESVHHTFRMVPLRSHLFDPGRTPFLTQVKLQITDLENFASTLADRIELEAND